ncbi:MAG: hypothetical protein QOH81_3096 [Sphingomonadales bacterium]|jgi:hypothetical protein|nr:hypothetical protein [Sphingomonadales bacterium]
MRHLVPFLLAIACAGPALADDVIPPVVGGHTWTQHQLEAVKARHPEIAWIRAEGMAEAGHAPILLGSTADIASVMKPVAHSDARLGVATEGRLQVVRQPFMSNSGHRLGTIAIAFRRPGGRNAATAAAVAAALSRSTLSAKNAADPWPYDAAYRGRTYGQKLVDRFVRGHPELLVMMIHATPPTSHVNVVIGSNIGRIGKAADEDDLRVIEKGSTNLEVADSGDRFETELPLNDPSGKRIGALGLVFMLHPGDDKNALHARGRAIRDALAREIPNSRALFAPAGK